MTPAPLALEVHDDAAAVADAVSGHVIRRLRAALDERDQTVVAFSGGSTPRAMLERLSRSELDWDRIVVAQVDERIAPDGDADRNWTMLHEALLEPAGVPEANRLPMPVTDADLEVAAQQYAERLAAVGVIDVVHLGLGADGHTASLIPDDPVLLIDDRAVALTAEYQGRRRMTLTFPALAAARAIVWEIVGAEKALAAAQLRAGEGAIPAVAVRRGGDVVMVCDRAAGGL